jgi:hypothetical protein
MPSAPERNKESADAVEPVTVRRNDYLGVDVEQRAGRLIGISRLGVVTAPAIDHRICHLPYLP